MLESENVRLSASGFGPTAPSKFDNENVTPFTSLPVTRQFSGVHAELSGSEPAATSSPSEKPSPSVSGFKGSVPSRASCAFESPSESLSAFGSARIVIVFSPDEFGSDVPAGFVARKTNWPDALAAIFNVRFAEAPDRLPETMVIVMGGGFEAGSS